jgi:transposase
MTMSRLPVLGIDIAKENYQVTLRHGQRTARHEFANDPGAFHRLDAWLRKQGAPQVHACLEATGRYGEALAEHLHDTGQVVSVVNPARIRYYADSLLARNKTDPLDADVIADFCLKQQPEPWTPPPPEIRELRALLHQYEALLDMRTQELNRQQAGHPSDSVAQLVAAHLAFLDEQLEQIKRLIQAHIQRHPDLRQQHELLESIPGIGNITAAFMVSLQLERFEDARAATAFVGLNPRVRQSGKSIRRRSVLSKIGDPQLRAILYWPAITAWRFNPVVRAFCERLAANGKTKMQIIGAAMRKLLCLAYGVVKSGAAFDPNYSQSVS